MSYTKSKTEHWRRHVQRNIEKAGKHYDTIALAVADIANINIGDAIYPKDRGGAWDAVDATTVTENELNIVTGSASISFVLREDYPINILRLGCTTSADATAILDTAETLYEDMYIPEGTFDVTTKRDTSKYSGIGVIEVNNVIQPTSKGRVDNIGGNLLSNTRWKVRTGWGPVSKYNHQGTGVIGALSVTSYTTGSNYVVCSTSGTSQYKVGDLMTFSGGSDADMEITSAKISALTPDTSFTISLPLGLVGASSAACSAVGIMAGDTTGSTGNGPDGWMKTATMYAWVDDHLENAYNDENRQIGIQKKANTAEYFYAQLPDSITESRRGKSVVFGGGCTHKIQSASGYWNTFIQTDGTGGTLTTSPPNEGLSYEWCEISVTVPTDATFIRMGYVFTGNTNDVYYITQPMGCSGSYIGDWNYQPMLNEYLIPIVKFSPLSYSVSAPDFGAVFDGGGDTYGFAIRLDAETNGVMSDDIKAISMQLEWRDTATDAAIGIRNTEDVPHIYGILEYSKVTTMMNTSQGILTLGNDGNGWVYTATSGLATPYACSIDINGFQLD